MNIELLDTLTSLSEQINAIAHSLPNLKNEHREVFFGELMNKSDQLTRYLKSIDLAAHGERQSSYPDQSKKCIQPTSCVSFHERLKHAMKAAGLTQKELAERAGVSQGFVSKLATGKTTDSRNIYIKLIADALGVSFGWLHYGTGEMYPANFSADNHEV